MKCKIGYYLSKNGLKKKRNMKNFENKIIQRYS